MTPEEVGRLKKAASVARSARNALEGVFRERLRSAAAEAIMADSSAGVVLQVFDSDLSGRVERYLVAGRRELVTTFRRWAEKYGVSLTQLQIERDAAVATLERHLAELGYT